MHNNETEKKEVHPRNTLNDLTGSEWIKFTRTWFVADSRRYWQNKDTELHPARYPEEMVHEFIRFFTKAGEWVLDPFAGSGATLVSCLEAGRNAAGVELVSTYADKTRSRLSERGPFETSAVVLCGDARKIASAEFWKRASSLGVPIAPVSGLPQFDFIMTSPPYWNMLRKSRGGVKSTQKQRAEGGLDTYYSDDRRDLGNIVDYDGFVESLGGVFDSMACLLREGRYMVIVIQNLRAPDGTVKPLAWDLARRVSKSFLFQGERIWCQNTKMLGIWGYPRIFVPNYHHHYCLVFRKPQ